MAEAICERGPNHNPADQVNPEEEEVDHAVNNPLNHEVVARKLLSFLHLNDLKSCRQVNSVWNRLSIPYLKRKCGYVSFNSDNYWTNMRNHGLEDMARFIQCMEASSNFPYVRLDVGTSIRSKPEDEALLLDFFRRISPVVTELMIRDEWGNNLFSQNIPEGLVFPSLEIFTMHIIQPEDCMEPNFQFITNVLRNAPVLDKLMLVDHNAVDGHAVTHFLESITAAKCVKISNLKIAAQIENDHLIYLSKMGLKLKTLYFDFWGSLLDQENLKMFLQTQSTTLQRLKIADFAMSSNFSVEFPCMKSLKSLMIKGSVLGRSCISCPNISYVNQFPALKCLSFTNAMDEWDEFLKFGIQPVPTVEELKLPGDFADEVSLQHAAHLFPNIKLLEVAAYLGILNIVYDTMPNIEELILNTKYVDMVDDVITGMSIMECQQIHTFTDAMFEDVERDHMFITTTKPVSCLKRLKILRLKCRRQADPVELTDVSCRLVLLKMKCLECLDFWGRCPPTNRVSTDVLLEMRKRFMVLC